MLTSVILCGGSGTRLWPLSREAFPKQFLSLTHAGSLLAETIARIGKLEADRLLIVSNEEHRFLVAATLQNQGLKASTGGNAIILEPSARNTAPAIALAALEALETDPDAMLLVLPADHVITGTETFVAAVATAVEAARSGAMVTFGIVPDSPHTGYGYIRSERAEGRAADDSTPMRVTEFVEKPDQATAERYVASGEYLWNSGMFVFRAARFLEELKKFRPEIHEACQAAFAGKTRDLDFLRVDEARFNACPDDSIDYAVMEQTDSALVVPLDAGWSDVGSWSALYEMQSKDADGNVARGDVITEDVSGCYLHSEGRLIAAIGLQDHVVVETDDVVLVAAMDRVQDVKKLVAQVRAKARDEHRFHKKVHRPWGTYEGIALGERFQVKRIQVKPGGRLSLQKHHHRAEHWVVVSGTALVSRGGEDTLLSENESTYIPLGVTHRLENPGVIPLELIEVQSGSYLGEDDIVRLEDTYGRT
ncbi:mannose-1-phosphate guanylyltransferase/mannose-6-phosphate isomerase [Allohahella sp. A8]|uniref:mannose-1-phosphate guanylyltransferase/mannose-6-phosphate isomerase n=1 Tax=Allohahella sp. A8 TaxID=3141461 RepID=UPI003A810BD0